MSALREAISTPCVVDFSHTRKEPFRFFLTSGVPPRGSELERRAEATETINYYPWGVERIGKVFTDPADETLAIQYLLCLSETHSLYAQVLDPLPLGPFYDLMVGRDYGDEVTRLISRRWPHTFDLLLKGGGMLGWPAAVRLLSSSSQWAVAMQVPFDWSDPEQLLPAGAYRLLMDRTLNSTAELLGAEEVRNELLPILAGDDDLTRKLNLAKSIIGAIGDLEDIAKALASGGVR